MESRTDQDEESQVEDISTASSENLDSLLIVASSKLWLILIGSLILTLVCLLWLLFGALTIESNGRGIVVNHCESTAEMDCSEQIYSYFPLEKGERIQVGQKAQVEFFNYNLSQRGYLIAEVIDVIKIPSTKKTINEFYKDESLVDYLTHDQDLVTTVILQPLKDPTMPHKYQWTLKNKPSMEKDILEKGSIGEVRILTQKQSPLSLLIE